MKIAVISNTNIFRVFKPFLLDIDFIDESNINTFNKETFYDVCFFILNNSEVINCALLDSFKSINTLEVLISANLSSNYISDLSKKWNLNILHGVIHFSNIKNSMLYSYNNIIEYKNIHKVLLKIDFEYQFIQVNKSTMDCIYSLRDYIQLNNSNLVNDVRVLLNKMNPADNSQNEKVVSSILKSSYHTPEYISLEGVKYVLEKMNENNIHTHAIEGVIRNYTYNNRNNNKPLNSNNNKILFYEVEQEYGFFSNLSDHAIYLDGCIWRTAEHYYQAQKFKNLDIKDKIRNTYLPTTAKKIANSNKSKYVNNWLFIKDNVMYNALTAKFTQHKELTQILIKTENKVLIEHTNNDFYWGDGGDGSGLNKLGKLLMKVRSQLQS